MLTATYNALRADILAGIEFLENEKQADILRHSRRLELIDLTDENLTVSFENDLGEIETRPCEIFHDLTADIFLILWNGDEMAADTDRAGETGIHGTRFYDLTDPENDGVWIKSTGWL